MDSVTLVSASFFFVVGRTLFAVGCARLVLICHWMLLVGSLDWPCICGREVLGQATGVGRLSGFSVERSVGVFGTVPVVVVVVGQAAGCLKDEGTENVRSLYTDVDCFCL